MFQKLASGMERMLYARPNLSFHKKNKEIARAGVVAGSVYVGTDLASKFLGKLAAYADFDYKTGEYFCNPDRLDLEKGYFAQIIHDINAAIKAYPQISGDPNPPIGELNNYILGGGWAKELNLTGKISECLSVTHHIEPDTVAQFSSKTQEVLSYDMSRLMDVAPELVKYTTVTEYGELVGIIAVASLAGLLIAKRFPEIKDYIQKHSVKLGDGIGSIMQCSRNSFKHNKDSSRNKN